MIFFTCFYIFNPPLGIERYNMTIDLVLADPYPVVLDGLVQMFRNVDDFSIKSCVHDADAAFDAVVKFKPDILVTELFLQNGKGLALIGDIRKNGFKTHPVVFTGAGVHDVSQVIDLGVQGLVSKSKPQQVLTTCLHSVYAGHKWLDQDLARNAVTHFFDKGAIHVSLPDVLTTREMMVAKLVSEGLPNKKIAQNLLITEGTTKLHLHHIYQKLNCSGRMALALHMQNYGRF
jgi:DNA-binding NarL/FixJ family response regulator